MPVACPAYSTASERACGGGWEGRCRRTALQGGLAGRAARPDPVHKPASTRGLPGGGAGQTGGRCAVSAGQAGTQHKAAAGNDNGWVPTTQDRTRQDSAQHSSSGRRVVVRLGRSRRGVLAEGGHVQCGPGRGGAGRTMRMASAMPPVASSKGNLPSSMTASSTPMLHTSACGKRKRQRGKWRWRRHQQQRRRQQTQAAAAAAAAEKGQHKGRQVSGAQVRGAGAG